MLRSMNLCPVTICQRHPVCLWGICPRRFGRPDGGKVRWLQQVHWEMEERFAWCTFMLASWPASAPITQFRQREDGCEPGAPGAGWWNREALSAGPENRLQAGLSSQRGHQPFRGLRLCFVFLSSFFNAICCLSLFLVLLDVFHWLSHRRTFVPRRVRCRIHVTKS